MAPDPVDLPELRRLAEAARDWAANGDPSTTAPLVALLDALPPSRVLALLDRIDALEAGLRGVGDLANEWRGALADPAIVDALGHGWVSCLWANLPALDALADPGAVAGEPESEETTGG